MTADEEKRLAALRSYAILDTPPEQDFDRLTQLAASICEVPIALITLIDEHRQWFKSAVGIDVRQTDLAISFCAVGAQQAGPMVVPDARLDPRFAGSPVVTGEPGIRFYACAPLVSPEGHALGTLAVADRVPRTLEPRQLQALENLAEHALLHMEHRRQRALLQTMHQERAVAEQDMARSQEQFRQLADAMPQIVWTADPDGRVDYANKAMFNYVGLRSVAPQPGIQWQEALHPDDLAPTTEGWARAVRLGQPFHTEYRLRSAADGHYRWMLVRAQPIRDPQDRIVKWYGTATDVHDLKSSISRAEQLARTLTTTLESIADAFIAVDRQGRVTYFNLQAEKLLGRTRDQVLGQLFLDVFPQGAQSGFLLACQRAVRERVPQTLEAYSPTAERWLEMRAYPSEEGLALYVRDITQQRASQLALRLSDERFELVARATTDAIWDWDRRTGKLWWNDGMHTLFGVPRDAPELNADAWAARIHPDDVQAVLASSDAYMEGPPTDRQWHAEYRFRREDGSYAEVLDRAFALRDESGNTIRMVGGMTDVTERNRAAQHALLEAQTQNEILAIQQEIAAEDLTLAQAMQLMAERAMSVTGSASAEVELVEGDELVCHAAAGGRNRGPGARVALQECMAGTAVELAQVKYSRDTETDPRVNRALCREVGARSVLVAPLRAAKQVVGVLRLTSPRPDAFSQQAITNLLMLSESLGGVIARHRIAQELRRSEEHYRLLFQGNPHPMCVYSPETLRILEVNQAAVDHYGYSADEFLQMRLQDIWAPPQAWDSEPRLVHVRGAGKTTGIHRRHAKKNGEIIDVEVTGDSIVFDGQPARMVLVMDITARLCAERELVRLGRAQRMLSACNEALIRAEDEQLLLERICRITVEIGGYRMAWVGFAHDDEARTVQPVAHAGANAEILTALDLSWSDATPAGRGSVGRAIASGRIVVVEDVNTDPSVAYWRDAVRSIGFKGIVSLPLRSKTTTLGVLCLYAPQALHIGAEELSLLEELANDLAFGITNLRALAEQRRLQDAVLKVASAVSSQAGEAFFEQLVRNMVDAVGAQAGYAARLEPGSPTTACSISAVADGTLVQSFSHAIAGPAHGILLGADRWQTAEPAVRHPLLAPGLAHHATGGSIGCRLDTAAGEPIGLLFVLFREPPKQVSLAASTLQIFAARAAAELERQQADAHIRDQASLLDKAQDAISVRGLDHRIQYWNRSCERLYGWSAERVVGQSITQLLYQEPSAFLARTAQTVRDGECTGEITQYSKDGKPICVEARWTLVRDDAGQPKAILAIDTDISQRKEVELAVHRMAFHDALTGLPNRQLFTEKLLRAREDCVETGYGGALLFVNLDNFKTLNETLGHETGDRLLQLAGERILACVPPSSTVARFGGDEFLVMLEGLPRDPTDSRHQATAHGERILETLGQPFTLGAFQHLTTACIGIALFRQADGPAGELLKQADLALYHAKAAGRNSIRFFEPELQQAVARRASLESDLRQALANQELVLHYQPQVHGNGQLLGVEALLRWNHPVRGMVSPAEFIPLAEETGLILAIGQWVVESACRMLARWQDDPATAGLTVSVNVSSRQFRHPEFVAQVVAAIAQHRIPPGNLTLELTESLLVYDMAAVIETMRTLKSHGIGLSLDDFGTGYSSLSYLKRMPLDHLKIDQSFVREVMTDPNDAAIARTVIALAHSLGLSVIAEGVELQSQRDFLHRHGCDAYQGYLFSRPLPVAQLEDLIRCWDRQALAA